MRAGFIAILHSIEEQAEICVARASGFAALAVFTLMVGLSWNLALACQVGGMLILAACVMLAAKAYLAPVRPVRKTELWMVLGPDVRPDPAVAQQIIGAVLRTCYLRFATHAAALSTALLTLSLGLRLIGGASEGLSTVEMAASP